jgi:hypothetical protein
MDSTKISFKGPIDLPQNNVRCAHGLGTLFSKGFLDRCQIWYGRGDELANAPFEPRMVGLNKLDEAEYRTVYCANCLNSKNPSAISWSIQWYDKDSIMVYFSLKNLKYIN